LLEQFDHCQWDVEELLQKIFLVFKNSDCLILYGYGSFVSKMTGFRLDNKDLIHGKYAIMPRTAVTPYKMVLVFFF
jgi:hypothetical protein